MKSKILIIGPTWVGDMVMAQCLFKTLKHEDPNRQIDVLAPAWSLPLLARMPEVSDVILMTLTHGQFNLRERYRIGKSLRPKKYTQAIVLPNSFKSALIPFFANIPVRTGWRGEMRYGVLNDLRQLDKKRYPLMIERFILLGLPKNSDLPAINPIPSLCVTTIQQETVLKKFQLTHSAKPILAICPGAEFGPAKRWPEEYYAEVANKKIADGWDVWIFGSANDKAVAEDIMHLTQNRCRNFAGNTKLEEAIDLLSITTSVLSNDSGLMHIAAALNKPLVAIYGPTSAQFTPPLNDAAKINSLSLPCQPCFKRTCPLEHHLCMRDLKPEIILRDMEN